MGRAWPVAVAVGGGVVVAGVVVWRQLLNWRSRKKTIGWPEGLELFGEFLSSEEAAEVLAEVEALKARLEAAPRKNRSYSRIPPAFAKKQQSRVMLQFGAYANANRLQETERVEPLPAALEKVAALLVKRGVLDQGEAPESCCVNLYEPGNWVPAHVDNAQFARPFCTVSLASEQPVEFSNGSTTIRVQLPVGSALRVDKAAADVWLHAVPPVSRRRVSLTFRRISDATKRRVAENRSETSKRKQRKAESKRRAKALKKQAKADHKLLLRANTLPAGPDDDDTRVESGGGSRLSPKNDDDRGQGQGQGQGRPPLSTEMASSGETGRRSESLSSAASVSARSRRSTPYSQVSSSSSSSRERADPRLVPEVETEHVWAVYEAIAPQWHGTRYKAWPRVAQFAREVGVPGALVGDVGCGNGKNAPDICANGAVCLACDVSKNLLAIAARDFRDAKRLPYDCMVADAAALPWRDATLDAALNIAVLHHISTPERRALVVAETLRVLRPGGRCLFYAWAMDQRDSARSGHVFDAPDVLVPFHLRLHGQYWRDTTDDAFVRDTQSPPPAHASPDPAKNALVLQRFCHVFHDGELETLVKHAADMANFSIRLDDVYYDQGNWAVAATKLPS